MRRVMALLVATLAICGIPTACFGDDPCPSVDQDRQIESLHAVYYRGGQLPPDPSEAEIEALRQLKAEPDLLEETKFLECAFPDNEELQAIAVRDHDRDGIKDFRINKLGEFRENDPDADCDGVANVLDGSPYDSTAMPGSPSCALEPDWHRITDDLNANGLPDKIDWRLLDAAGGGEKRPADVQEGLFRDYKIILVDRGSRMSADIVTELDHVIRDIFRDQIAPDFPPLRVIATDVAMCGNDDFYGWASPENSAVYLTPETLDLLPIMRLEILVHEITHTLQYARDFSADDLRGFRTRNHFDSDGFHAFAQSLGWNAVPNLQPSPPAYRLAVHVCEFDYPFDLKYLNRPPKDWQADWTSFVNADSGLPTALNPQLKSHHMVSWYGFGDAWEWEAEHRAAFALNKVLEAASRLCKADEVTVFSQRLHADMDDKEWSYANENAIGLASYENVITPQFHVDPKTWEALARRFLFSSYPNVCTE